MQPAPPDNVVTNADPPSAIFLRMPTVMRLSGLGRSTIYRLIGEQSFPNPVLLGRRAVAWRRTDLDRWSDARRVVGL